MCFTFISVFIYTVLLIYFSYIVLRCCHSELCFLYHSPDISQGYLSLAMQFYSEKSVSGIRHTVHSYMILNKRFDIGTVICPRVVVLARGRRRLSRGQITVPISNLLFNDNLLHNYLLFRRKVSKRINLLE